MTATRSAPAALFGAAAALFATSASAASVDLRGNGGWNAGPLGVTLDDGTTARVTAESTRYRSGKAWLGQWSHGLGVYNGPRDAHFLDGSGYGETVWFDFSTAFRLTGVDLSHVSPFSAETLRVLDRDGNTLGDFDALATPGTDSASLDLFALGDRSFDRIGLSAVGPHSAFKIRGLQGVSAVPTPTAAAAGIALLVGGAMRRRRSVAAA